MSASVLQEGEPLVQKTEEAPDSFLEFVSEAVEVADRIVEVTKDEALAAEFFSIAIRS